MYQVYIIENEESRKYIGLSEDVEKRLLGHNEGVSKWTRGKGPWKIIWTSKPMDLSEARKMENLMKRQKGGKGLKTLMSKYGS